MKRLARRAVGKFAMSEKPLHLEGNLVSLLFLTPLDMAFVTVFTFGFLNFEF